MELWMKILEKIVEISYFGERRYKKGKKYWKKIAKKSYFY